MPATPSPRHVQVCGNDHSPWVQAVLLGLREKGIDHTMVTLPPLSVFLESGVLMPVAKIDDGPWQLDSERILVALGFPGVPPEARALLTQTFGRSALHRTSGPVEFWHRFSFVHDEHPSTARRLWNQLLRPFSMLYFLVLISFARRTLAVPTDAELIEAFAAWQERLPGGAEFLGGDAPDTTDLQLFGIVQMCASIPGRPLAILRGAPELARLRVWIEAMQRRFVDHPHLYGGPYFAPTTGGVEPAGPAEQAAYWLGSLFMWGMLPLTLPTAIYFALRVRKKGYVPDVGSATPGAQAVGNP